MIPPVTASEEGKGRTESGGFKRVIRNVVCGFGARWLN